MKQRELSKILINNLAPFDKALLSRDNLLLEGLWEGPKALLLARTQQLTGKHLLVLGEADEAHLYHDLPFFTDTPIVEFPAWETLPSESIAPSADVVGERYDVLKTLLSGGPHIILSSLTSVLQKLIPCETFQKQTLHLAVGDTTPFQQLQAQLHEMGYIRSPVAADKGEYAVRGGIIDLFPVNLPDAYRIEFWGDTIESMRIYDPVGQKSVRPAECVAITPAKELELLDTDGPMATLLDYLGAETIVAFDDLLAIEDRYASLCSMLAQPLKTLATFDDLLQQVEPLQQLYFSQQAAEELGATEVAEKGQANLYAADLSTHHITLEIFDRKLEATRWYHPFEPLETPLLTAAQGEHTLDGQELLLALGESHEPAELFLLYADETERIAFQKQLDELSVIVPPNAQWVQGYLSSGFSVRQEPPIVLLPYTEITRRHRLRRPKLRSTYHTTPAEVYNLSAGEHVVHLHNGIGRFLGLERRPNHQNVETEFFLIEYANDAKLYVPIDQAHLVSKYIGAKDEQPKMHQLGSKRWKRTRENTEQAILGYAAELLDTYAKREVRKGFAYPPDSDLMHAFEDTFPYVETEDQIAAIADVKTDMAAEKPTDRLVCGDVGYGKTEVAMRAAVKAVVDGGKQVAILVPTTVLALQHYENFSERMKAFPITIASLSRTGGARKTREILQGIADGSVDIVIGTHRLISKDVHFKELGLVIIDEEQRFGVKAKEHLKKLKANVDCLTLTATPIPRTLYLSLMGARDLSTIATPPQDRLPITTVIAEPDPQLIRNALLRELTRGGQAYVIHNRVESIYEYTSRIRKQLPNARIITGHGQMSADELGEVFHAFKEGRADILVATTIVENGIDIPNANTIIIDRADRFGLADLYQLRGRVGRWRRKAYAYLLVPKHRARDELVSKRLGALADLSGYGGGMKLAMRDLEIRGAGNILGTEQSGQVSAIGFHLYCKLLKRTIEALQGKLPHGFIDTKLELPVDARLPDSYVNEQILRMEIYQRLGEALTWEEVDTVWSEIKDRFGSPPIEAKRLYHLTKTRVYAARRGVISLQWERGSLAIERKRGEKREQHKLSFTLPDAPDQLEKKFVQLLKNLN